jgi:hypothetical protein
MAYTSHFPSAGLLWWFLKRNVLPVVVKTPGIDSKYAEVQDGFLMNTHSKRKLEEDGYFVKRVDEFTPEIYSRLQMEYAHLAADRKRRKLTEQFNKFYTRHARSTS